MDLVICSPISRTQWTHPIMELEIVFRELVVLPSRLEAARHVAVQLHAVLVEDVAVEDLEGVEVAAVGDPAVVSSSLF